MIKRILFLFLFLKIAPLVHSQKKELRFSINSGPIWTRLDVSPEGMFREQNYPFFITDFLITYQSNKAHYSLGYSGYMLKTSINFKNSYAYYGSITGRLNSIIMQYGYDLFKLKNQNIFFQTTVGNYFIFDQYTGLRSQGGGGLPPDLSYLNATYHKKSYRPNSFMVLPFVGLFIRKDFTKRVNFILGYKRTIGFQILEETHILYKEQNQPDQNFTINNRGSGNQFLISASVRLWQKKNSKIKQPISPYDY